ncbi:MAG: LysR family transcriptional regulator [Myxococcota bacterium]
MNELPSLPSILAFVQVAQLGAFNEASKALDLSPSATSKAVSRLEERLGTKLLHRTTRSVSLTPEGERYLEGAKKALEDLGAIGQEVADTRATPKGRLKVSAPSPMGRLWLADIIADFIKQWPEVEVELTLADHLADLASEGIDLAIRSGGMAESAHLIARRLYNEELMVCAAPDYWEKNGRPRHPDDLITHCCLNFRAAQTGRLFPWMFTIDGEPQRRDANGPFVVDEGEMNLRMTLNGTGVGQLPGYMVRRHLKTGALIEVLEDYRPPKTPISAMYLDRRLLSPRVRAFVDHVAKAGRDLETSPASRATGTGEISKR